jgi:tetratricopeptide (TPR) repeat protein
MGISLYCLVRNISFRRLLTPWFAFAIAIPVTLLSLAWLYDCQIWITRLQDFGFADVTILKGRVVPPGGGTVNEWATILVLSLILQAAVLRPIVFPFDRNTLRNAVLLLMLSVNAAALFLTFSRGAYLALLVLMIGLAVHIMRGRSRAMLQLGAAVLLVFVASVVVSNIMSVGAVARTAMLYATEQERRSVGGRLNVWSNSLELAPTDWLYGTGPGTFAMRYLPKAGLGEGHPFVGRPLNTGLALLLEEGVTGLTLHLSVAIAAVLLGLRSMVRMPIVRAYPTAVLVAGVCAFWFREMTFSSLTESRIVMCLYWLVLALLVNSASAQGNSRHGGKVAQAALAIISILVPVASASAFAFRQVQERSEKAAVMATRAVSTGDLYQASALINQAIATRGEPYYVSLRGFINALEVMRPFDARRPFDEIKPQQNRVQLESALADYATAIEANPNDDVFWHNRAWIRLALGHEPSQAASDMKRAIQIDGSNPVYRISLGLLYELEAQPNQALEQYGSALASSPSILDSEFARQLKARSPGLWQAALLKAIDTLRSRDPHDVDVNTRSRLGRLYIEQGEFESAGRALGSAVSLMPQYSRAWANLARVYMHNNDLDSAEQYLQTAEILDSADPIVLTLLGEIAKANGDEDGATDLERQAAAAARYPTSEHAQRVKRIYGTDAILRDDILPAGLLNYCNPSPAQTE